MRAAIGFDSHRLQKSDKPLVIGGVENYCGLCASSHSDGDALCHSLIDCISTHFLNKSIGELYSDKDEKTKGANSLSRLESVYNKALRPKIINIDAVVQTDAVQISAISGEIKRNLSSSLGIRESDIAIKGKTTEGVFSRPLINVWCVVLFA